MNTDTGYYNFIRNNAPFLATGALLSFLSSFEQTFFISIFGGEIRAAYNLTNGEWGIIYMIGTGASAAVMAFAGGLADKFRVRQLGISVVLLLGLAHRMDRLRIVLRSDDLRDNAPIQLAWP